MSTLLAPLRYVQGRGALDRLGDELATVGTHPLVVADDTVWSLVGGAVEDSLRRAGLPVVREGFGTLATARAVTRIADRAGATGADVVVGVGGGSVVDAVKAAAHQAGLRTAVVPTLASTDAPCSALAALYDDEGRSTGYRSLPRSPDLVLVDTQVVAGAPARLLVAGVGDALSTWVEARAVARGDGTTPAGARPTVAGTTLARATWDVLHADAERAVEAVRRHLVTPAVERVVEACTLLSGLGFESGGLAVAHAVHDGLTGDARTRRSAHGEKVNVGTLAQLVLEGAPHDEVVALVELTARLGLPTSTAEVGIPADDVGALTAVARGATAPGTSAHAMPFEVRVPDLVDALRSLDDLAAGVRGRAGLPAPVAPAG